MLATPPHRPTIKTAFPIFGSPQKYRKMACPHAKGMSATAITLIEELQPYYGGKNPTSDPLWSLYELDNADKHRTLNLTQSGIIPGATILTNTGSVSPTWMGTGIAHHGAKIASFRLSDYSSDDYVKMEGQAEGLITFQDPNSPWHQKKIIRLVSNALVYVERTVVPRFEKFFSSTPQVVGYRFAS